MEKANDESVAERDRQLADALLKRVRACAKQMSELLICSDQQLILIAHGQELLVGSSGMDRTFPLQIQEEVLNQAEEMG